MRQGCLCDPGWLGYDCSLARCPYGDDPHTPYAWIKWNPRAGRNVFADQVNELQRVVCTATSGGFFLSFRGVQTMRLPFDATVDQVEVGCLLNFTAYLPACSLACLPSQSVCFFD